MRSKGFASCFILAAIMASGAAFADSYTGESTPIGEEYTRPSDDTGNLESESNQGCRKRRSSGPYILAGLGGSSVQSDMKADVKYVLKSDEALDYYGDAEFSDEFIPWASKKGFSEIRVTRINDDGEIFDFEMYRRLQPLSEHNNHVSGVLGFGYCFGFNNGFSCGFEGLLDFGSSNRVSKKIDDLEYTTSSSGLIPSVSIILGYNVSTKRDVIFYLKGGGAFITTNAQVFGINGKVKMSKLTPIIAVGVNFAVNDSLSIRLEGEHRFEAKKNSSITCSEANIETEQADISCARTIELQQRVKSYAIRLMASWYI
ncbi:MAG: hypothetical protein LBB29_00365 [Holosporaceae bacterium]|jgi:hypothetical protein|nr:hypothetical protein [Holosporaceae bacterium]